MTLIKGILTTTEVLDNGFAHSLDDLYYMAESINKSPVQLRTIYLDHRADLPPVGKILHCSVETLPDKPNIFALFFEAEMDMDRMGNRNGFSMSFFGKNCISINETLKSKTDLAANIVLGLNPATFSEKQAIKFLNDIQPLFTYPVFARDYYEHNIEGLFLPAIVLVLSSVSLGALQQIGARLADAIIDNVFEDKKRKASAVKINIDTAAGTTMRVHIPTDGSIQSIRGSLEDACKLLAASEGIGNQDGYLAVTYDSQGCREIRNITPPTLDKTI